MSETMRVSYRGTLDDDVPYGSYGTLRLVDIDKKQPIARVLFDNQEVKKETHIDNIVQEPS